MEGLVPMAGDQTGCASVGRVYECGQGSVRFQRECVCVSVAQGGGYDCS